MHRFSLIIVCQALSCAVALAAEPKPAGLDLAALVGKPESEFAPVGERFRADQGSLTRTYFVPASPIRFARMHKFFSDWDAALAKIDAGNFSPAAREEHAKLRETARGELKQLIERETALRHAAPLLPFAPLIVNLEESRRQLERVDPSAVARQLAGIRKQLDELRGQLEAGLRGGGLTVNKAQATTAADMTIALRASLKTWFNFYNGYDPLFTWWLVEPYKEADQALGDYAGYLRDKLAPKAAEPKPAPKLADAVTAPSAAPASSDVPDLQKMMAAPRSEMRGVIARYWADRSKSGRGPGPTPFLTPRQIDTANQAHSGWLAGLGALNFDKLSRDGQIDYLLLQNHIRHELAQLDLQARANDAAKKLVPFGASVSALSAAIKRKEPADASKAAAALKDLRDQIEVARASIPKVQPSAAAAATPLLVGMKVTLREWYDRFGKGDADWATEVKDPYRATARELDTFLAALRDRVNGTAKDDSGITGRPIGRDALLVELAAEMIPYTPEQLVAIAEREYAWCEAEMKKASRDMGLGDDWKKAVEKVKGLHVEPGRQPELIRDLAHEAIDYLKKHDLVTLPPLAVETWRMEMMPAQRQLYSPFFTGGEVITVSFPTSAMAHEAKLQSLRGNNIHFSRATVHHELIPGHHLQGYMTARYRPYRGMFGTSFWTEGWALYWEFILYDMGFPRTPEDRVGFLFWRMHRCARIVFSINYHLGNWTPKQCIDYLVRKVGHERDNATAEVRRSFIGGYGPLYQAGYLLGALQFRALRRELVEGGKMTAKEYHDAVLKENRIPVAMLRAILTGEKLNREGPAPWRFYGEISEVKGEAP